MDNLSAGYRSAWADGRTSLDTSHTAVQNPSSESKGRCVLIEYGTWRPYAGSDALLLALVLLVVGSVLAYLGTRFPQPVGVSRPGRTVSVLLTLIWGLALASLAVAGLTYYQALVQQVGAYTPPTSPVSPITTLAGLATFLIVTVLSRRAGLKLALGAAIVGTLTATFLVFAGWALFGFSYSSYPIPFVLNAGSKVLCFVVAITLFLPQKNGRPRIAPSPVEEAGYAS
jgi:hypothetical protein